MTKWNVCQAQIEKRGEDDWAVLEFNEGESLAVGVFDGAGGIIKAKDASAAAKNAFLSFIKNFKNELKDQKIGCYDVWKKIFNKMHLSVFETYGATTAVCGLFFRCRSTNEVILHWANVGDSRVFVVTKDHEYKILSLDENDPWRRNALRNYIPRSLDIKIV